MLRPSMRPYQTEDDFWRMRAFLRQVFELNGRRERAWHVARLDYARWHTCTNCAHVRLEDVTFLWEAGDQIAAIMLPDGGPGEAHLCVHPDFRSPELENEMIDLAEARLMVDLPEGGRRLYVWADHQETLRQEILTRRGYRRDTWPETQWRRDLTAPIPDAPLAPGYTIRPLGDGLELLERCYASGLGFHPDDIQYALDNRADPTWYRNIQTAPLYRRDLDLVAVDPNGAIASFCTIWFDDVTRSACFEPVATVPAHQRRGLARAVMTEGLRRLQRMGATLAFVGGLSERANALYRSVMGDDCDLYEVWMREQAAGA